MTTSNYQNKFHHFWIFKIKTVERSKFICFLNLFSKMNFYSQKFLLKHSNLCIHDIENFTRIPKSSHLTFYDFSTVFYEFSKLQHKIWNRNGKREKSPLRFSPWNRPRLIPANRSFWYYWSGSRDAQLAPCTWSNLCPRSICLLPPGISTGRAK
jgi:hypothetical protein